jgi:hypothetical protein
MKHRPRLMLFRRSYELADRVEAHIDEPWSFGEMELDDSKNPVSIARFSRTSLLHRYIFAIIAVTERSFFTDKDDLYDDDPSLIDEDAALFAEYGIDFVPFDEALASSSGDRPFLTWFQSQEEPAFFPLWEKLTDEVFHLLFANREFLLRFNTSLAAWLETEPSIGGRDEKGRVKRCPIPRWVRRAVFYRDRGRCVFCFRDLSGLVDLDSEDNYDHIVPLASEGVNDASNIQLLCGECNRKKSAGTPQTGQRYTPWWPSDDV